MAQGTCYCLSLCLLTISLYICSSEQASSLKQQQHSHKVLTREQKFHISSYTQPHDNSPIVTTKHDEIYPTTPATTALPPPLIVTVPSTNPISVIPSPDTTTPVQSPPLPITNPVTTPAITPPVTNPVTTYPAPTAGVPATTPVTNPVGPPPPAAASGGGGGQSWCVAKSGVSEAAIQAALDYACGIGGADCSAIQDGASCFSPVSLENHASYAFNSYYQKNPVQTSCDFGGSAMVTTSNPSSGSCVFPASSSSSSSTSSPVTTANPAPMTASSGGAAVPGSVTPPSILNSSNPAASVDGTIGYGEPPQSFNPSISMSISLQPFIDFTTLAASILTVRLALHV